MYAHRGDAELARRAVHFAQTDAGLAQKDVELAQKTPELAQKASEFAQSTSELQEKTAEFRQKITELEQRTADLMAVKRRGDDLEVALRARESEIERLSGELAVANNRVAQAQASLGDAKRQFEAKLEARTAALASEMAALRSSTCWRITAPLRATARLLSRVDIDSVWIPLAIGWRVVRAGSTAPLRDVRAVLTIARSGQFGTAWYLARNPGVAADQIDAVLHYVMYGAHEGRDPTPAFNSSDYLAHNADVAATGINPFVHYILHGAREGRSGRGGGAPAGLCQHSIQSETEKGSMAQLMAPTDAPFNDDGYFVTRFMHYLLQSRPDLQPAFDLSRKRSRLEYCRWFLLDASGEYGLSAAAYPDDLLARLAAYGDAAGMRAQSFLREKQRLAVVAPKSDRADAVERPEPELHGANIVGYCRGEFGMGEFTRTVVRSFEAAGPPFSVIDCPKIGMHGTCDTSIDHLISGAQRFKANIVNINADILPTLYFRFGEVFFTDRYNIGYWAWELPKCPPEFDLALSMVDEVWAISDFTAESFRTRSPVPVLSMPLAVSVPALQGQYTKPFFGLPEDRFTFLFTFDAASYLGRKNPIAAVRAFKQAFPRGTEKVHLLLKTMNVSPAAQPLWDALLAEARSDPRIQIWNRRFSREEVVGLSSVCDAVVSLHRSEGFGLTVAEAMLLGKPVVVTNYSGTRNFAREDTACVVDFKLVPVPTGQYPFCGNQVWAEPDIGHAASLMRRLVDDEPYRRDVARAGQSFVAENLNPTVVGARYAARLDQLRRSSFKKCSLGS